MKVKVKAKLNNLRISPRKVRVSADMVRNCSIDEAIFRLNNTIKKANEPVRKLIESAVANAQNDFDLNIEDLVVADIQVGEGVTLKRWIPRAYGRATPILKRSSHIYVVLETDKGIKKVVKDDEKVKESTKKKSGREDIIEKVDIKEDSIIKSSKKGHFEVEGKRKESREKGWSKKIFRKKSI